MTLEEAEKICKIIETADDGCSLCVKDMVRQFNNGEFGFVWKYNTNDYQRDFVSVEPA